MLYNTARLVRRNIYLFVSFLILAIQGGVLMSVSLDKLIIEYGTPHYERIHQTSHVFKDETTNRLKRRDMSAG